VVFGRTRHGASAARSPVAPVPLTLLSLSSSSNNYLRAASWGNQKRLTHAKLYRPDFGRRGPLFPPSSYRGESYRVAVRPDDVLNLQRSRLHVHPRVRQAPYMRHETIPHSFDGKGHDTTTQERDTHTRVR